MSSIGPEVSKEKMFENVDGGRPDGRRFLLSDFLNSYDVLRGTL